MMPFPESFPVPLIYIEETDSTNHYLNDLCNKQDVSELTTVVANYQTLGRGQRGNSWESERGKKSDIQLRTLSHFFRSPQTISPISNHLFIH